MATIEEKARDFSHFKDTCKKENAISYAVRKLSYEGFKTGAEWMLEKAIERYSLEIDEINNLLGLIDKNATELIDKEKSIEKFRKALED